MTENLQTLTTELRVMNPADILGRVLWFSADKGYGFIRPNDGGEDVFVRFSALAPDVDHAGFRSLTEGQVVVFLRTDDARGPRADDVRPL